MLMCFRKGLPGLVVVFVALLFCCCKEDDLDVPYEYKSPNYDSVSIGLTSDTVLLSLPDNFYNQIKMHNYFEAEGVGYLALYDARSQSVCVFDFDRKKIAHRFFLGSIIDKKDIHKASVYVKNFDTILLVNKGSLYIIDSSGKQKFFCSLPKKDAVLFDYTKTPLVSQSKIWVPEHLASNDNSRAAVQAQRLFFNIDLPSRRISERYALPQYYSNHIIGKRFIYNYSCINDDNRLVLSFRVDSTLYETDLSDYNRSYFARSRFQNEPIISVNKLDNSKLNESEKFRAKHTYGPIYFDRYRGRYLRVSYLGMSPVEFKASGNRRSQSIAILDRNFQVIGEQRIDSTIYTDFMFFDRRGCLYARFKSSDEYAVHFVKLAYELGNGKPD